MSVELARFFESHGHPRVLVVGDLMLDRYLWGSVERISPEAPIPVLRVEREEHRAGGAGCVALALRALGAEVVLAGVVGDDDNGKRLLHELEEERIDASCVQLLRDRPTTCKTRLIARDQHVLRVDRENASPCGEAVRAGLLAGCRARFGDVSAVLVSDYAKGLLGPAVLEQLISEARQANLPCLVDPRRGGDYGRYKGAAGMTPNRREAFEATGIEPLDPRSCEACAEALVEKLELDFAVITLDKDGMFLKIRGHPGRRFPTRALSVYDVSGAGDQVLATLGHSLAGTPAWRSHEVLEAGVRLANVAAGLEVQKVGALPVSREELLADMRGSFCPSTAKMLDVEGLRPLRQRAREEGRRVVFTNGCFDILHTGHISYLEYSRSLGDLLVVGVNADASIQRLKGPTRPVNPLAARMRLLAGLSCVDYVVAFEDDTPQALIEQVLPDVLVKGEDWKDKGVVGSEVVIRHGGEVILAPMTQGFSTTNIVEKIRGQEEAGDGRSHHADPRGQPGQEDRPAEKARLGL